MFFDIFENRVLKFHKEYSTVFLVFNTKIYEIYFLYFFYEDVTAHSFEKMFYCIYFKI